MKNSKTLDSLEDWLIRLETLSSIEINLGLERVEAVLKRLNLKNFEYVISIAGTNGKGSTVAILSALLKEMGFCVGSYTSPHLHKYNERININGISVSDNQIVQAFRRVELKRRGEPLTYFEYGTLAALSIFSETHVDIAILEVGLGGRLDAVNAIDSNACVITNVTLDHRQWLGNDIESIALEKAGIMRKNKPVVFGSKTVPSNIKKHAHKIGSDLLLAGIDYDFLVNENGTWDWSCKSIVVNNIKNLSLNGIHQIENASAALALIASLKNIKFPSKKIINRSLKDIFLPGRQEVVCLNDVIWMFDVAHNPDAARVLYDTILKLDIEGNLIIVVGFLMDKQVSSFVKIIHSLVHRWIVCDLDHPRAIPAEELSFLISSQLDKPVQITDSISIALNHAHANAKPGDIVLVTGSFYTVGPALKWIELQTQDK